MTHILKPLPYSYDALEPHYDTETLKIHHGKHHQAYVDTLNKLLENHPSLVTQSLEQLLRMWDTIPAEIREKVLNQAGGVWNHDFFWNSMAPAKTGIPDNKPHGKLADMINAAFRDFDTFQKCFKASALAQFGSGWTWLIFTEAGALDIQNTSNQDCPVSQGHKPLLTLDVWEHAYYLKFQNRRTDWIDAWWNVVDWEKVAGRM